MRLSTSFFIWGTSHSSMVQLDVGLFYLCTEKTQRLQYIHVPQSSFKQADATTAAAARSWERRRAHLICKRSSEIHLHLRKGLFYPENKRVLPKLPDSLSHSRLHLPSYDWVTGAARFLIKRRSLKSSPDLIWLQVHQQYYIYICDWFFVFCNETLLIQNQVTAIKMTFWCPAIISRLAEMSVQNSLLSLACSKHSDTIMNYIAGLQDKSWDFRAELSATPLPHNCMTITWHSQHQARSDLREWED